MIQNYSYQSQLVFVVIFLYSTKLNHCSDQAKPMIFSSLLMFINSFISLKSHKPILLNLTNDLIQWFHPFIWAYFHEIILWLYLYFYQLIAGLNLFFFCCFALRFLSFSYVNSKLSKGFLVFLVNLYYLNFLILQFNLFQIIPEIFQIFNSMPYLVQVILNCQ